MVFPVVMYGCDSWTIKKAEHGWPKYKSKEEGKGNGPSLLEEGWGDCADSTVVSPVPSTVPSTE